MNKQIRKIEVELEMQESVLGVIRIHQIKIFWSNMDEPTFDNELPYRYEYHEIDEIQESIAKYYQVDADNIDIINPYI